MQKDVIYIDVEDDITAIIGKVKSSKEKIVALVPPKRIGLLQSAVNLRLLNRTAQQGDKRLVLVTSNQALMALASSAKIPVARNLQSKPELAEVPLLSVDDGEDVIDGAELPIGELARTGDSPTSAAIEPKKPSDAGVVTKATPPVAGAALAKPKVKKGVKIPNFDSFRKRLVLIIGGAVLLIGFLIWAIVFAPHATIIITAKTTSATVNQKVTLDPKATTTPDTNTIKSLVKQEKKQLSVEFAPTGKKEVGEKATGTVTFSTNNISNLGTSIPAGTRLMSSGGKTYVTNSAVSMTIDNYRGAPVGITASDRGAASNGASGSVSGAPSGINASITGPTSGGTDKQVTIVSADDVRQATSKLEEQQTDDMKPALAKGFGGDAVAIDLSYTSQRSDPVSVPAVDQEATGNAKLTAEVTYSMTAIAKSDLATYLNATLKKQLGDDDSQRVYDDGTGDVSFTQFANGDGGVQSVQLAANGKTGPTINESRVKNEAKGKSYGEVQSQVKATEGVVDVDVQFSPFWVRSVPSNTDKITVQFKVNES